MNRQLTTKDGQQRDQMKARLGKYFDENGRLDPPRQDPWDREPSKGFGVTVGLLLAVLLLAVVGILARNGGGLLP